MNTLKRGLYCLLLLQISLFGHAAQILVTSPADNGAGTLRQAIALAASGDEILFDGNLTIALDSALKLGKKSLSIGSSGGNSATLDGGWDGTDSDLRYCRIFEIVGKAGVNLSIRNLILQNAKAGITTQTIGSSTLTGYLGGGILANMSAGSLSLEEVHITQCAAQSPDAVSNAYGGGAFVHGASILNCSFSNNHIAGSTAQGGGVYLNSCSATHITTHGNTIEATNAFGGGIYAKSSTLQNSTASENTLVGGNATVGGGMYCSSCTVTSALASQNQMTSGGISQGGGLYGLQSNITLGTATYNQSRSTGENYGGGIYCHSGSLYSCTASHNILHSDDAAFGGGIYLYALNTSAGVTLNNGIVTNNSLEAINRPYGGGINLYNANLNNCLITNNSCLVLGASASIGGGVYNFNGTLRGCTITDNTAGTVNSVAGGIQNRDGYVYNTIIWGNYANTYPQFLLPHALGTFENCAAQGSLPPGINNQILSEMNLASDGPAFIAPVSFIGNAGSEAERTQIENANWKVRCGSPCIDAGNNSHIASGVTTDLEGNSRILNALVDAGAYEYAAQLYQMDATIGSGYQIAPASASVAECSEHTFTIALEAPYELDAVTYNGADVSAQLTAVPGGFEYTVANVHENGLLAVSAVLPQYSVTASASQGGSVSPASQWVTWGSNPVFTISPNPGYELISASYNMEDVMGDVAVIPGGYSYTRTNVQFDGLLTVNFRLKTYTLTAAWDAGGTVTPDTMVVNWGAEHTYVLTPGEGYEVHSALYNGSDVRAALQEVNGHSEYTLENVQANGHLEVTFALQEFTLTASAGTGGSVTPTQQVVTWGSGAACQITPNEGYELVAATYNAVDVLSELIPVNNGYEFTVAAMHSNGGLQLQFQKLQFNLQATAGTGGSVTPASVVADWGSAQRFTLVPDPGYELTSASYNGTDVLAELTTVAGGYQYLAGNVRANGLLEAHFRIKTYTLTAASGAGGTITPNTMVVNWGAEHTFVLTPNEGYEVLSALYNRSDVRAALQGVNGHSEYTLENVQTNGHLEVTFALQEFTLTASAGTGGSVTPAQQVVTWGSGAACQITPNEGYELIAATYNSVNVLSELIPVNDGYEFTVAAMHSNGGLQLQFQKLQFNLQATAGTGGSVTPASVVADWGSEQHFTLVPDPGYELTAARYHGIDILSDLTPLANGWQYTANPVVEQGNLEVSFGLKEFELTAVAGTGGRVDPETQTVTWGSDFTFNITLEPGYELAGATYNEEDVLNQLREVAGGYEFTRQNIREAGLLSLSIRLMEFDITASFGTGGTVSPVTDQVSWGSSAVFSILPGEAYEVVSVRFNGTEVVGQLVAVSDGYEFTAENITTDGTVNVTFRRKQYTLSVTASTGGSVNPMSQVVDWGAQQTFTILPDEGFELTSVFYNNNSILSQLVGIPGGYEYTRNDIRESGNLEVVFVPITYTLTASAAAGGRVTPETSVVAWGSDQTFIITPEPGYEVSQALYNGMDVLDLLVLTGQGYTYTVHRIQTNGDLELQFELRGISVHTQISEGGSITPASAVVTYGHDTTFLLIPDPGYEIVSAQFNGTDVQENITPADEGFTLTLEQLTDHGTLNIGFALKELHLTVSSGEGVNITPQDTLVHWGGRVDFSILPDIGYQLEAIRYNGVDIAAQLEPKVPAGYSFAVNSVTQNGLLEARYSRQRFTQRVQLDAGGQVAILNNQVAWGDSVVFRIEVFSGYTLGSVYYNGADVSQLLKLTGAGYELICRNIHSEGLLTVNFTVRVPGALTQAEPPSTGLHIYPVPATTTLTVEFPGALTGTLRLLDSSGRLVAMDEVREATEQTLDVQAFKPGVYQLLFISEQGARYSQRWIRANE